MSEESGKLLESGETSNAMSFNLYRYKRSFVDTASVLDLIQHKDKTLLEFENFDNLRAALEALTPREREVIALRFFDNLSQTKIAQRLNVSQMHVSRLQNRALKRLRELLSADARLITDERQRGGSDTDASAQSITFTSDAISDKPDDYVEITAEEEAQILTALQEAQTLLNRLLDTIDVNLSLLNDSIRSVRTATAILSDSNQMARARLTHQEDLAGFSKSLVGSNK